VQLKDRLAVVTGASSGIGAAVVVELARRGVIVAAVARRADRLEETVANASGAFAIQGDVGDRAQCERIIEDVKAHAGRAVDILVNNAGISPGEDPVHRTVEDVERVMAVNFMGPVYLTGAVLPDMVERRCGSIVNVTSVSGYVPNPGEPAYGASKAALSRWSHGLAVDLAGSGVHVGVLSPGPIDTEIWEGTTAGYDGKLFAPDGVARAVGRMIEREQVHVTFPRRFGAVGAMYPLVGRPFRWGLRRYAATRDH
jgi:NAD(P)-dependent dehydrogenase (short-subunit alcohol dehydrogenase family)